MFFEQRAKAPAPQRGSVFTRSLILWLHPRDCAARRALCIAAARRRARGLLYDPLGIYSPLCAEHARRVLSCQRCSRLRSMRVERSGLAGCVVAGYSHEASSTRPGCCRRPPQLFRVDGTHERVPPAPIYSLVRAIAHSTERGCRMLPHKMRRLKALFSALAPRAARPHFCHMGALHSQPSTSRLARWRMPRGSVEDANMLGLTGQNEHSEKWRQPRSRDAVPMAAHPDPDVEVGSSAPTREDFAPHTVSAKLENR